MIKLIALLLNLVSVILKHAPWLTPFLLIGSMATCATPFVLAYVPLSDALEYLKYYFVFLLLCAGLVVGILAAAWARKGS